MTELDEAKVRADFCTYAATFRNVTKVWFEQDPEDGEWSPKYNGTGTALTVAWPAYLHRARQDHAEQRALEAAEDAIDAADDCDSYDAAKLKRACKDAIRAMAKGLQPPPQTYDESGFSAT